jgi:hypothetical protein
MDGSSHGDFSLRFFYRYWGYPVAHEGMDGRHARCHTGWSDHDQPEAEIVTACEVPVGSALAIAQASSLALRIWEDNGFA